MKKNILVIFCFVSLMSLLSSQERLYSSYSGYRKKFICKNDYQVIEDCVGENWITLEKYEPINIKKGTILSNKNDPAFAGFEYLGLEPVGCVSPDYLKIDKNDVFPNFITYKFKDSELNARWVPIWYFEALEQTNRDLVLKAEPKRLTWDADIAPTVWYDDIPEVASVVLSNCGMTFYTPLEDKNTGFLFSELKKINDTTYEVTAYPAVQDNNEDISWEPYKENYPLLKDGNPVKFRFEINGKSMKIYNAENNKIVFDLIQMSAEWVELYEDFMRTNIVPEALILPEEYLRKASTEKRTITDTSLSVGSLLCTVDFLRLRETEQITSRTITTMNKGTLVKIQEIGSKQTIDGIASNWVKIEVIPVGRDVEGKRLYEDTTGWCFGGYLE